MSRCNPGETLASERMGNVASPIVHHLQTRDTMSHEMLEMPPAYDDAEMLQVVCEQQADEARWQDKIEPEFFAAGNAEITFRNADGKTLTYRVRRVDDARGVRYFVDVLTDGQWLYLGIFNPAAKSDDELLFVTRASKYHPACRVANAFRKLVTPILFGFTLPPGYKLAHNGTCPCCGRKLTSERSLAHGIGPKCEKKVASRAK